MLIALRIVSYASTFNATHVHAQANALKAQVRIYSNKKKKIVQNIEFMIGVKHSK
jgi:hypothetical protein